MESVLVAKKVEHLQNELNTIKKELLAQKATVTLKGIWEGKIEEKDFEPLLPFEFGSSGRSLRLDGRGKQSLLILQSSFAVL